MVEEFIMINPNNSSGFGKLRVKVNNEVLFRNLLEHLVEMNVITVSLQSD